jgi:hypothetical protein
MMSRRLFLSRAAAAALTQAKVAPAAATLSFDGQSYQRKPGANGGSKQIVAARFPEPV